MVFWDRWSPYLSGRLDRFYCIMYRTHPLLLAQGALARIPYCDAAGILSSDHITIVYMYIVQCPHGISSSESRLHCISPSRAPPGICMQCQHWNLAYSAVLLLNVKSDRVSQLCAVRDGANPSVGRSVQRATQRVQIKYLTHYKIRFH